MNVESLPMRSVATTGGGSFYPQLSSDEAAKIYEQFLDEKFTGVVLSWFLIRLREYAYQLVNTKYKLGHNDLILHVTRPGVLPQRYGPILDGIRSQIGELTWEQVCERLEGEGKRRNEKKSDGDDDDNDDDDGDDSDDNVAFEQAAEGQDL